MGDPGPGVVAAELCRTAGGFYARGWMLGTSGNLSAVLARDPLRLAITASGVDKGRLGPEQIVTIDGAGRVRGGDGRASDETGLHLAIVARRGAGSVLHTHTIWNGLASEAGAGEGGYALEGFEMLKGLRDFPKRGSASTSRRRFGHGWRRPVSPTSAGRRRGRCPSGRAPTRSCRHTRRRSSASRRPAATSPPT